MDMASIAGWCVLPLGALWQFLIIVAISFIIVIIISMMNFIIISAKAGLSQAAAVNGALNPWHPNGRLPVYASG